MGWGYGWGWRPYVSVAQRRTKAAKAMERLRRKGTNIQPVVLAGRNIADTFWGRSWCEHLEKFSDYENRLPRGRTYVRNGSVCHLDIQKGKIEAKVSGSEIYDVEIKVSALPKQKWKNLKGHCAGRVGSMLELLQGKLSSQVMAIVTDKTGGLFPLPKEINLDCSCPDWAELCKHAAAVLYGVGARLDEAPEILFLLRGVNHNELISKDAAKAVVAMTPAGKKRMLDEGSLTQVFGIDLDSAKPSRKVHTSRLLEKSGSSQAVGRRISKAAHVAESPNGAPSAAKSRKRRKILSFRTAGGRGDKFRGAS